MASSHIISDIHMLSDDVQYMDSSDQISTSTNYLVMIVHANPKMLRDVVVMSIRNMYKALKPCLLHLVSVLVVTRISKMINM